MITECFMNLKNRNVRAKELQEQGHKVRKSSSRNQLLHPKYVEDYPHPLTEADKGFGNTIYKTGFSTLYHIDTID